MICSGMAFVPSDSIFQLHEDHNHHHLPSTSPSVLSSSYAPQDFHGLSTLMMRRSMSFSGVDRYEETTRVDDDMSDDGCPLGEKKRRLNMEQVKALEKSFELGNKLEPERKMQLARALGLKPRQIAIWFQNRRARWKTKQLEKDYDILKKQFEALKADNVALKTQNHKLHSELLGLKNKESSGAGLINLNKDNERSWSNGSENSTIDVNIGAATVTTSADDHSPPFSNPINKNGFPSSIAATSLTQLLQSSARPDLQSHKTDQNAHDEGFRNMFNGIDQEQPNFWPWPEQQHFH